MIRRQDQAGGVHLTSTLLRRKTTASIPKSVTRLFNKDISHNVFDIDDDSEDLVMLSEEVSKSNKGKEIEAIHQVVEVSDNNLCESGTEKYRTVSATKTSKDYPLVSNDIINIDCHGSDLSYGDGYASKDLVILGEEVTKSNKGKQIEARHQPSIEYFGQTSGIESSKDPLLVYLSYDDGDDSDDLMILGEEVNKINKGKAIETIHQEVSDYTFCQPAVKSLGSAPKDVIDIDDDADDLILIGEDVSKSNKGKTIEAIPEVVAHLDNIDVPSRIEVPFTFFRESQSDKVLRRSTFESSTCNDTQSAATNINSRQPPTSTNFESATKATSVCTSYSMYQAHLDNINIPSRTEAPFTSFRDAGIGSRRSTFESNTWYDTQSAATSFNTYMPPASTNFESATNYNTYKPPVSTNFERATKASSDYNSSSMNQARFDNINMPSRTETPFTSSRDSGIGLRRSTFDSSNWYGTQSEATNSHLNSSVNFKSAKKSRLNNVDIATSNKRKSTAPTTSANFISAKKAHMDNFDISYEIGASFTWKSTFESSTWYGTQSEATNSHYKASSRSSRLSLPANSTSSRSSQLSLPANSKIQGSTMNSSLLSAAPQSVSRTKKADSSMRLLDAPKRPTATNIISDALMGSSSFSQSVPYKKKADAPMRLLPAPKPSTSTKTVSGKKAAGSGSKKSQATSSYNSSAFMGSSLFSKSVSSKKKAYAPMRLLTASNPSATSSYKPSRSLYSGAPSMKKQAAAPKASNSKVQGSSTGLRSVAAPSCPLLTYNWQVL